MFFDFAQFGPFSCFLMFAIMIYYIFFHGRRKRPKRRSFPPPPIHPGTKNLYPEGTKIHRSDRIVLDFLRKDNKKWLDSQNLLLSGDYICSSGEKKEVYVNTVMEFIGKTIFLDMVYDYAGFKDGAASLSPAEICIGLEYVRSITVYRSGNASYMRMKLSDPELPEEMLFEFNGPDAQRMAEEAKRRILVEKEKPLE